MIAFVFALAGLAIGIGYGYLLGRVHQVDSQRRRR
jgi:hypothetical protein